MRDRARQPAQRLARAQDALGHRRLADQERRRDLAGRQAADRAQRERDLRFGGQRRVAAGERQAEQFVVGPPVRSPVVRPSAAAPCAGRRPVGSGQAHASVAASSASLSLADLVAAEPVKGLAAGGGRQPAAGVGGHPVARPVLDRLDERVLHRVLGQADVAGARGEGGPDPGRLLPVGALKRLPSRVHAPSLAGPADDGGRNGSGESGAGPGTSLSGGKRN